MLRIGAATILILTNSQFVREEIPSLYFCRCSYTYILAIFSSPFSLGSFVSDGQHEGGLTSITTNIDNYCTTLIDIVTSFVSNICNVEILFAISCCNHRHTTFYISKTFHQGSILTIYLEVNHLGNLLSVFHYMYFVLALCAGIHISIQFCKWATNDLTCSSNYFRTVLDDLIQWFHTECGNKLIRHQANNRVLSTNKCRICTKIICAAAYNIYVIVFVDFSTTCIILACDKLVYNNTILCFPPKWHMLFITLTIEFDAQFSLYLGEEIEVCAIKGPCVFKIISPFVAAATGSNPVGIFIPYIICLKHSPFSSIKSIHFLLSQLMHALLLGSIASDKLFVTTQPFWKTEIFTVLVLIALFIVGSQFDIVVGNIQIV